MTNSGGARHSMEHDDTGTGDAQQTDEDDMSPASGTGVDVGPAPAGGVSRLPDRWSSGTGGSANPGESAGRGDECSRRLSERESRETDASCEWVVTGGGWYSYDGVLTVERGNGGAETRRGEQ